MAAGWRHGSRAVVCWRLFPPWNQTQRFKQAAHMGGHPGPNSSPSSLSTVAASAGDADVGCPGPWAALSHSPTPDPVLPGPGGLPVFLDAISKDDLDLEDYCLQEYPGPREAVGTGGGDGEGAPPDGAVATGLDTPPRPSLPNPPASALRPGSTQGLLCGPRAHTPRIPLATTPGLHFARRALSPGPLGGSYVQERPMDATLGSSGWGRGRGQATAAVARDTGAAAFRKSGTRNEWDNDDGGGGGGGGEEGGEAEVAPLKRLRSPGTFPMAGKRDCTRCLSEDGVGDAVSHAGQVGMAGPKCSEDGDGRCVNSTWTVPGEERAAAGCGVEGEDCRPGLGGQEGTATGFRLPPPVPSARPSDALSVMATGGQMTCSACLMPIEGGVPSGCRLKSPLAFCLAGAMWWPRFR